jgi:ATP-binding cassette subfamily F protein 3
MERLTRDPREGAALEFAFKAPERSGRVVFELEDGRISAGEKLLLEEVELWLERGEHVSLVGPNGAGKTTLIETLAGRRELESGKLRTGHNVKVGFLSQHADELSHGTARTVLEATTRATGLTPNKARALLGRFMFSGEEAEKPLEGLSGGERRRLSLAILVYSGANVLILDEPTNHLDLESRESLEHALGEFTGSLLLVSHDRALLDAVGKRTVAIEDGSLRSYVGGWPEYVRAREERAAARAAKPAKPAQPAKHANASGSPPEPRLVAPARSSSPRAQQQLEREIEVAEADLRALEDELSAPTAWSTQSKTAESQARHQAAKRTVEELYARWEAIAG